MRDQNGGGIPVFVERKKVTPIFTSMYYQGYNSLTIYDETPFILSFRSSKGGRPKGIRFSRVSFRCVFSRSVINEREWGSVDWYL